MNNGWIKLHRKILDSIIFTSEKSFKIWIWCLLKASHSDSEFYLGRKKINLKKGQFVFGRKKAEEELRISGSTVWWWMIQLELSRYIDIKKTAKYSIVTILNWEKYQVVDRCVDNKKTTDGQQMDTYKNDKNVKNDKKDIYTPQNLSKQFFKKEKHFNTILNEFSKAGNIDIIKLEEEFNHFILYWTEPNKSGSKVKWELQKTFDVKRRLYTWMRNKQNWSKENNKGITII